MNTAHRLIISFFVFFTFALQSHAVDIGPGTVGDHIRVSLGDEAVDYVVLPGTDFETPLDSTTFYLQKGSLLVDGTLAPITFTVSGPPDNASAIYIQSREFATALDIKGGVTIHIPSTYSDNYANRPTYALMVRGNNIAAGRTHVAEIDGLTVLAEAQAALGMLFSDTTIKVSNSSIETKGERSAANYSPNAVELQFGVTLDISNTSLKTSGKNVYGLHSYDSVVNGDGLTVETSGDGAYGMYFRSQGANNLGYGDKSISGVKNSTVTTSGAGAYGVVLYSSADLSDPKYALSLELDNVKVATSGDGAMGAYVSNGKAVLDMVNGSEIEASGAESAGIYIVSGTANIEDSKVASENYAGIYAGNAANVNSTDSDISGATAIWASDAGTSTTGSNIVISGGTLTSTADAAIYVGHVNSSAQKVIYSTITLTDGVVATSSTGVLLDNKASTGIVELAVSNGTHVQGAVHSDSNGAYMSVSIDSTSSWTMDGESSMDDFTLEGKLHITDELTIRNDFTIGENAEFVWGEDAFISVDCFNVNIDSGAKVSVTFENYLEGGTVILADFITLICEGLTDDANDYFVCDQGSGEGYFEFTDDNKLIFTFNFIPEPAAYAAIAGAFILAFASYRRGRLNK